MVDKDGIDRDVTDNDAEYMVSLARSTGRAVGRLHFAAPVTHVYNPLDYAFEAHRTYLYQRLATLGYPHWAGACFYTALTLALGMCGLLYLSDSEILGWELLGVASTLLVLQVAVVQISERWSYR